MLVKEKSVHKMASSLLFTGLAEKECGKLYELLRPVHKSYFQGEVVINEGDLVEDIGLVCSGCLISVKIDQNGNQKLMQPRRQVQIVGLEAATHPTRMSPVTVLSIGKAEVIFFPYQRFFDGSLPYELQPRIVLNMLGILSHIVEKQINKLEIISYRSLRSRIQAYLHTMAVRHGSTTFRICMNREELASYLGVNRSALSHELSKMRAEGLVDYHKNQFTVNDEPEIAPIPSCYQCPFAVRD